METLNELNRIIRYYNDNSIVEELKRIAKLKGYSIFDYKSTHPINLNIWGVRCNEDGDIFNDSRILFYQQKDGNWVVKLYDITTDPGKHYLLNPINNKGTAILKEGQYRGMWKIGYHRQDKGHKALIQVGACTVIRDANRDSKLDLKGVEDTGYFGINEHRNKRWSIGYYVGKFSAGCQVHRDSTLFENEYIPFVEKAIGSSTVSYTLINENDLDIIL